MGDNPVDAAVRREVKFPISRYVSAVVHSESLKVDEQKRILGLQKYQGEGVSLRFSDKYGNDLLTVGAEASHYIESTRQGAAFHNGFGPVIRVNLIDVFKAFKGVKKD